MISLRLSNTLTGTFWPEALEEALSQATPEIFNSDQGSQFTATAFTNRLEAVGIATSMARMRIPRRGRAIDKVFIERLWRSVKCEEVYLCDYTDGWHVETSLDAYFRLYNEERIHRSLDYRTQAEVYRDRGSSGGRSSVEKRIAIARDKEDRLVSTTKRKLQQRPCRSCEGS